MGRFIALLFSVALPFTVFTAQAELVLLQGHVRAMPPGQPNTAAFMQLKNTGQNPITLVSAHTLAANKSEFHTHSVNEKGMMSMSQVAAINIKPQQTFEFKSGAHHVMLMGLIKPLKPGQTVGLSLTDNNGSQYEYDLPVVSLLDNTSDKTAPHHHHHSNHSHH